MTKAALAHQENFGFYELSPEQFESQINDAISNYKNVLEAVKSNHQVSWRSSAQPLEEAAEKLDRLWQLLDHLNAVANTPEIREVYERLLPVVSNFGVTVYQDPKLYDIYQSLESSEEFATLSAAQKNLIINILRDFKLSGVNLAPEQRQEFKELSERLSDIENKYSNNVLDATQDWTYHVAPEAVDLLEGIPEHALALAAKKATEKNLQGWLLNLDASCLNAVLSYAANRQLREEFYMAYSTRASNEGNMAGKWDNTPIIAEILSIRQKLSKLTGHDNFAEYSLVPKMASSVKAVQTFLEDLVVKVKPQAQNEYNELKKFAKSQGFEQEMLPWDISYFSEKMRIANYDISQEQLRPYFPEPRVLNGLFNVANKLFGLNIEEIFDFATWNDAVRMFKVIDADNVLRGHFYIDLYTREGKRGGAWMSECTQRIRFASDLLQTPIAYLNCNFAPPIEQQPGLLTHSDVETLFHEFGHTLHHVLTKVDYYSVSGINGVAWDAVELPSQLMENWAWEWQVIQDISENIHTGEHLPRDLYDKLLASKNFQSALFLSRQLQFALFDLRIHCNSPRDSGRTAHEIMQEVRKEVSVTPTPAVNRFENSFSHIFSGGYAAGYYSYLWAEVLSCDVYAKFKASDIFNSQLGNSFLINFLEKGGSQPAMELFVAFAGREPNIDALLEHHAIV